MKVICIGSKMTEKQSRIFAYIKRISKECYFPPTYRQIADEFGMCVKGAYDHVALIEKRGLVKRTRRGIIIIDTRSDL